MKWAVVNALGAVVWLLGLFFAKSAAAPSWNLLVADDYRFVVGLLFGVAGLAILLWTNLTSTT